MPTKAELAAKDPEVLLGKIHKEFPDLSWDNYQFIDSGWDHEVIILDNKIVFRFPNSNEYLSKLKDEVKFLNDLKGKVTINIPNYTYVADDYSFAGYPIVPGKQLSVEEYKKLDQSIKDQIAKQLSDFLSTIHSFQNDITTKLPMYMFSDQARLKKQAPTFLKAVLSEDDYRVVDIMLNDVDKVLKTGFPRTFIHGDVYGGHIFWDKDKNQLGLIDFSDMCMGDPAYDFAELNDYGSDFVASLYSNYDGPKDDTFLDRAKKYWRWSGIFMMVDHFINHKTSFEIARKTFDATKLELK